MRYGSVPLSSYDFTTVMYVCDLSQVNFMQGEVGQHSFQPEMFSLPPVNDFDTFAQLKLG